MKIITVPADVKLLGPDGSVVESVSFWKFAEGRWLNETEATPTLTKQRRWLKVIDLFETAQKPGSTILLEDEDHATLLKVLEKVNPTIPPMIARRLMPFVDAVENAPAPSAAHALPESASAPS